MQFIPSRNTWSNIGETLGKGVGEGYTNRADELALQNAVGLLGPNAKPRDILNAITKAHTYNPAAKQNLVKNYIGVAEFEKAEKKYNEAQQEKQDKLDRERRSIIASYKLLKPGTSDEEAAEATKDLTAADLRSHVQKPENITDYKVAQNKSKRLEPIEKATREAGESAQQTILASEAAILNNEKYTTTEKWLDTAIDATKSPILKLLKSSTAQQLEAYAPIAIAGFSNKMSGVMSVRKINLIAEKAASPNKTKETNRLLIYTDLYDKKLDIMKQQFTDEIIEKNPYGLIPGDLNKKVEDKLRPYKEMVKKDMNLLLEGKKPATEMSKIGILEAGKAAAKEDEIYVTTPEGKRGYIPREKLGTPGYEKYSEVK